MLFRILSLLAGAYFIIPLNAQTIFYNSGIESVDLQKKYEKAMFSLINSEHKKFYALAEEIIRYEPDCFKIKAHCAFQNFQITKGKAPFPKIAKLALNSSPKDRVDSVYFEILEAKVSDPSIDISPYLKKLAKAAPSVEVYFLLGNFHVGKNDLKTAHKYFFRAYRIDNDFSPIFSIMAQTSRELGHDDLASDFLTRYIQALPDNPKSNEIMGNYLAGKGEFDKAVEHFKKAYELDPSYEPALEKAKILRSQFSRK